MTSPHKTVIVLRGLPGSGKTSFTRFLAKHTCVIIDDYWTGPYNGLEVGKLTYRFNGSRIKEAISWAKAQLEELIFQPGDRLDLFGNRQIEEVGINPAFGWAILLDNGVVISQQALLLFIDLRKTATPITCTGSSAPL